MNTNAGIRSCRHSVNEWLQNDVQNKLIVSSVFSFSCDPLLIFASRCLATTNGSPIFQMNLHVNDASELQGEVYSSMKQTKSPVSSLQHLFWWRDCVNNEKETQEARFLTFAWRTYVVLVLTQ